MLKTSLPSRARRAFGASLLAVAVVLVGTTAWAAQPQVKATLRHTSRAVPVRGVTLTPPRYPKDAVDQKVEGTVILIVDVAADGTVSKVVVERAKPAGVFDAASMEAVKKWTFKPKMNGGKAVASRVRVPVDFRMDDPDAKPSAKQG